MIHIRTTLLAITIAIAGCRPAKVPSTILQPVVTASTNDTSVKSVGPWILTPSHQPHTYHSISQTTVHELSDPSIHQRSIEVTTAFTISLNQSQSSLIISGQIDTLRFSPQNQFIPDNNPLTLPWFFKGELVPTALTITVKNSHLMNGSCSSFINPILSDLYSAVAVYPTRLTPDFTWRDSTLLTTCTTGGIPTRRKTIHSFRIIGERAFNTSRALLLQRLDSIYISGDGAEGNHQVHLEGIGTATANIYISLGIGVILSVELSEKTEIAITNSGKTRYFMQEVTQRLKTTS